MKFSETLVYKVLSVPGEEWDKSCGYIFALKIPIILMVMIIGVPIAIAIDFLCSATKIEGL